jgi:hypothetical protein
MPLDTAKANAKTEALNAAFATIGLSGDTVMPRSKDKLEPVAYEYHVASHLNRLADARKKKAQAAAVKSGIMFDPEKQPMAIGTNALIYSGDVIEIAVTVTTPATRLDQAGLVADLEKAGLKIEKINAIVLANTYENRAPHKFLSTLITSR